MSHECVSELKITVEIKTTSGGYIKKEFEDMDDAREFIEEYYGRHNNCT